MKLSCPRGIVTFAGIAGLRAAGVGVLMLAAVLLPPAARADILYVTNSGANTVSRVDESGTGVVTTFATGLDDPFGIVLAPNGNFYVANQANSAPGGFGTISQITASGSVTTFATVGSTPDGLAVDGAGDLFVVNFSSGTISEIPTTGSNAGVPTTYASGLDEPTGLAFSPTGTLYVAVQSGDIYTVGTSGSATLYTFAGSNTNPTGMAFDSGSNLYVSLLGPIPGEVYKYTSPSTETTFAAIFTDPEGLAFDSGGNLIVANLGSGSGGDHSSNEITIVNSSGSLVENITGFADPAYIVDASLLVPAPVISSGLTASGTEGLPFTYPITASNNPVSFGATGLPAGVGYNASTGLISGTPTASGTFPVTITASTLGGTGSANLVITLASPIYVNFSGLKGSYTGLGATGGADTGLFSLSLTSKGGFTGKLVLAGEDYRLAGLFSPDGTFSSTLSVGGTTLDVVLTVDPSLPGVSGTLTAATTGGTNSYSLESGLIGKFNAHTIPTGVAGRYTAILPAVSGTDATSPQVPGFGAMTVTTKGAVHLAGKLGDGTAFSVAGQLDLDGTTCTLYSPLYHKKGSIAGVITFESSANSDWDGLLTWIKPPVAGAVYYPGGFSIGVDLLAAKYASPPLTSGTGIVTLAGGNLSSAISDSFTAVSAHKLMVSGTSGVSLTLTPGTGAFSGHFLYPDTNKKTPFSGVIYQKPGPPAGFGLFLGADQSGEVEITQ